MKWDFFGSGLGVLALGLTLMVALPPPWWPKMPTTLVQLGIVFGLMLVALGFGLMGVGSWPALPEPKGPSAFLLGGLAAVLIGVGWFLYDWSELHPNEQNSSNIVQINHALYTEVVPIKLASISFYQHSTVIWTSEPDRGYYILTERDPGTWRFQPELRWIALTPEERRAAFAEHGKVPTGMHDPYGGFATYLLNNPSEWGNAGWLIDLCQINGGAVSYKKLPSGFEIGPFPAGVSTSAAITYKFYFDGNKVVSSKLSDNVAPTCSPVSDLSYPAPTNPPALPHPSPAPRQPPAGK